MVTKLLPEKVESHRAALVFEYVPGRTLSEVVAQDGPITPERAAWIRDEAARASAELPSITDFMNVRRRIPTGSTRGLAGGVGLRCAPRRGRTRCIVFMAVPLVEWGDLEEP